MSRPPPSAKNTTESGGADAAIIQAAAEWRTRIDAGLAPGEEEQLSAWLEADERHAEIFGQMDGTWSLLDRATEIPIELLGVSSPVNVVVFTDSPPRCARRMTWWAGSIAAAAAVVIVSVLAWRGAFPTQPQYSVAASAGAGLVKRVNLPDGSTVRLNSDSAVQVEYSAGARRIELVRGEASFEVAKDPARPFVVRTAGVDVCAIGTVFTVSRRSQGVEVLVTEGKVQVNEATQGGSLIVPSTSSRAASGDGPKAALTAGEKVVIAVQPRATPVPVSPTVVAAAEIAEALAWQERRLDFFESTPLAQIAAEFNRFNHHQLVVADPALAGQRFAGSFRADDPETFLELIETRPGVKVERKASETVILRAP